MDTDSDGVVEVHEMRQHCTNFGGNSLDEPEEIQRCVEADQACIGGAPLKR